MASIDSEVQFVQAIQKLKFIDDEEWHQVLHQLFQALCFMTLSKAELDSIMHFLQENLSHGDLVALQLAVVTGDSSKLPLGFSNSTQKRNNSFSSFAPSRNTVTVSLDPVLEKGQATAVKQERSPVPANDIDVQVKNVNPQDDEQPMNCIDSVGQVDIKMVPNQNENLLYIAEGPFKREQLQNGSACKGNNYMYSVETKNRQAFF